MVGQLKLTYKNCYSLCLDILDKSNALCSVKYAAGNCAASHSSVTDAVACYVLSVNWICFTN